jgi:hypothetical protein
VEKKEAKTETDILKILEDYIPRNNPRKWVKLQSTIAYRRLVLTLLEEIVVELRKLNNTNSPSNI